MATRQDAARQDAARQDAVRQDALTEREKGLFPEPPSKEEDLQTPPNEPVDETNYIVATACSETEKVKAALEGEAGTGQSPPVKSPEGAGEKSKVKKEAGSKCSITLTEPLARKLMKSKARPSMHQALLRHSELSHVALPEDGNVVLNDVAHQSARSAEAHATAQGTDVLLASAEEDQKIIKETLIKDEKDEARLIAVMKRQLGTMTKLTPPEPAFYKHSGANWVYLTCANRRRKQPAAAQGDKEMNVRMYAKYHCAYTDLVLAHVPADEYVAKANSYGFHGDQIQQFESFKVLHEARILAAPFAQTARKEYRGDDNEDKLEKIKDLAQESVRQAGGQANPKMIELLQTLGVEVVQLVPEESSSSDSSSVTTGKSPATDTMSIASSSSASKKRRTVSPEHKVDVRQRLGKKHEEIKPKDPREVKDSEICELADKVREMASKKGEERHKQANKILDKAKELGVSKGLLLFRTDDDPIQIVTPLEVLKANDPDHYKDYMAPDERKDQELSDFQHTARDIVKDAITVPSKIGSTSVVCPICKEGQVVYRSDNARRWKNSYREARRSIESHMRRAHADCKPPRKENVMSSVAAIAEGRGRKE